MIYRSILVSLVLLLALLASCSALSLKKSTVKTVKDVELERYLGLWYQVAYFPNRFQPGNCGVTTAEYQIDEKGRISVYNVCWQEREMTTVKQDIRGRAFTTKDPAKLKVQFFFPFRANYWIIDLDTENYTYAVVSGPNRKYLWILYRDFEIPVSLYEQIVEKLNRQGFATEKLVLTGSLLADY